jgi:hypothetical protein
MKDTARSPNVGSVAMLLRNAPSSKRKRLRNAYPVHWQLRPLP